MKKYIYLYSNTFDVLAGYCSSTKLNLLPYLSKNLLRDISRIDKDLYNKYRTSHFKSFEDEGIVSLLKEVDGASANRMLHIIQEVDVDETELPYFTGEPPVRAARPRRAEPARDAGIPIDFFAPVAVEGENYDEEGDPDA